LFCVFRTLPVEYRAVSFEETLRMNAKAVVAVGVLCVVLAVFLGTFVSTTYAAAAGTEEPKTGLGEVFKKREATGVGPTKTQLAITIGATIVMIAVVKFL
jgi:heme A synthase